MNKVLRVLLVDDSAADAELIVHQLNKSGWQLEHELVDTAHDMRRALGERQWDVILCDYSMPNMNPYLALDVLRETELDIPLIVISGKIGEEEAIKLLKAGCHDYLMKSDLFRLSDVINRETKEAIVREKNRILDKKLQKYQILSDAASDSMLFMDEAGNILDVNSAAIKCYGYSFEEFLTKNISDLEQISNQKLAKTQLEAAIAGNIVFEAIHQRKDKTTFFAEVSSQGGLLKGQKIIFSIVRDMTERKLNEEQREHYLKDLLESQRVAHIGTWRLDVKTNQVIWSDELYKMYGFDPSVPPPPYTEHMKLFAPESWEKLSTALEITRTSGIPYELELETSKTDGSKGWMWTRGEADKDSRGNTISLWGTAQDITSRRQAENALVESEILFRSSFESATVGITLFGENGIFIKVNDRACEMWGYTREELVRLHFNDITYKEDQVIGADVVKKMISGEINSAVFEKRYINKNGTVIWALVSTSAIRDTLNDIKYFISHIQDITKSKEAAERINSVLEGTIETLALVVETKDPYTSGHQKRVAEIAVAIAENLGLPQGQIRGLYLAGIVHDLGKIQVPSEILTKPGKLTNIEFELIKCHSETAYNLLKNVDFPWPIAEIVYQHHERIDGSGYPRKLKGDSILIEAKIIGVADVFEAMSSHRPYRPALPIETALAELEKNKGVLYDPDVVEACLRVLKNN